MYTHQQQGRNVLAPCFICAGFGKRIFKRKYSFREKNDSEWHSLFVCLEAVETEKKTTLGHEPVVLVLKEQSLDAEVLLVLTKREPSTLNCNK